MPKRRKKLTPEMEETAWSMHKKGKSISKIGKIMGVSQSCAWGMIYRKEHNLDNQEFYNRMAQEQGFENYPARREDYARKKGYKNQGEYYAALSEKRQKRKLNQDFGEFIRDYLKDSGKSQTRVAREIGVSQVMVSYCANGKDIFSDEVLKRLFSLPDITMKKIPKSLANLLIEINLK